MTTDKARKTAAAYYQAQKQNPQVMARRRERSIAWGRDNRRDPTTWPKPILNELRKRARQLGVPFNLSVNDVIVPDKCPVFGTAFIFGERNHPHGPSVDRLTPSLGYVAGNIRVISRRANAIKNDASSPEELEAVANYMRLESER